MWVLGVDILFERTPMLFNELEKTVGAYPDTLNKRLKEMLKYDLVEPTVEIVEEKNKIKHRLTAKGRKLMPQVKEFARCSEELESGILS